MSSQLPADFEAMPEPSPDPETAADPLAAPGYAEQVTAATAAHDNAVSAAHETLKQRMENAYQIFKTDLDRAARIWEDTYNVIRQGAGIATGITEVIDHAGQDATTAR